MSWLGEHIAPSFWEYGIGSVRLEVVWKKKTENLILTSKPAEGGRGRKLEFSLVPQQLCILVFCSCVRCASDLLEAMGHPADHHQPASTDQTAQTTTLITIRPS